MSNAKELFHAIAAEARENAIAELTEAMAEAGPEIWNALKTRCGKEKAAFTVMDLLQCAIDDGAIRAFKPDGEKDKYLGADVIDDGCMLIRDTDGVGLEVVESNASDSSCSSD